MKLTFTEDQWSQLVEDLVGKIESAYHRAKDPFTLPGLTPAAYAANAPGGLRFSEPMRPPEIAELVRRYLTVRD